MCILVTSGKLNVHVDCEPLSQVRISKLLQHLIEPQRSRLSHTNEIRGPGVIDCRPCHIHQAVYTIGQSAYCALDVRAGQPELTSIAI